VDEVLEIAEKLSQAIARSVRFRELRKAEAAAMKDSAALDLIRKRAEAAAAIAAKEKARQPIEPDEKRALAALEQQVRVSPVIAALSRAQADFQEMWNLVNQHLTAALEPPAPPPGSPSA
jgi:cell fate (sporulation/competence/biofilm development) regulator YlbF (YheA/YmcA/DUF963 family)